MQNEKTALPGVSQEDHEETNRDEDFNMGACLQEADPLLGWFGLAAGVKQFRLRQQKRGWQKKGGM